MSLAFFVAAPRPRHSSAGITVLHHLIEDLRAQGHAATWVPFSRKDGLDVFHEGIPSEAKSPNAIVIYPEIVTGNPMAAVNVVRYYLNQEGAVHGNAVSASTQEFNLAYAPEFHPAPHGVLTRLVNLPEPEPWDADEFEDRTACATFIGKGNRYNECFIVPDSMEITLFDPPTKDELFAVLRHVKLLYTWDSVSALNLEAILLGAIPVLLSALPPVPDDGLLGRVPMGSAVWDGETFRVQLPDDFAAQRDALLRRMQEIQQAYPHKLSEAVTAMRAHFGL